VSGEAWMMLACCLLTLFSTVVAALGGIILKQVVGRLDIHRREIDEIRKDVAAHSSDIAALKQWKNDQK
jgi:hypothetical protein